MTWVNGGSRLAAIALATGVAAACAGGGKGGTTARVAGGTAPTTTRAAHVTVFAAASLKNAFDAEKKAFIAGEPGASVDISYAGSQDLVAQLRAGAPADVLATADQTSMAAVASQLAAPAQTFARNRLVVVVAAGNPQHVATLADLARHGLTVVLAGPTVPAGRYARQALAAAHVTVTPKSLEDNVRGVLTKVRLGEADAGIVYATDVTSAGSAVAAVPIPSSPVASYPMAPVTSRGRGFVAFVLSPPGENILRRFGFLPPT